MNEVQPLLTEYRGVWLLALFDLPVDTAEAKRRYVNFRNVLLKDGFTMLQYSVYARYCESEEASKAHRSKVRRNLPEKGNVRLVHITDRQFGLMEVFSGKSGKKPENRPPQLLLF